MSYCLTTTDPPRRREWQHIFGTDHLPVLSDRPRVQSHAQGDILAYDLNLRALTGPQRTRFAAWISRRYHIEYADALRWVTTSVSWPILAADCQAVDLTLEHDEETAAGDSQGARPSLLSFFGRLVRRVLRRPAVAG